MFIFIFRLSIILLVLSLLGYIFTVIREKIFLRKNMVVIDNIHLTQKDIDATDVREFIFQGIRTRAGDEVKVITRSNKKIRGTVIGMKIEDKSIHIITRDNKIKKIDIMNIDDYEMITKYGKFF